MQQTDQNRLQMWKQVSRYLTLHQSVWSGNRPFSAAVAALQASITAADAAINGQTTTSTGLTADKEALEAIAIARVVIIARSAKVLALDTGDNALLAAVSYNKSSLMRLPGAELMQRLRSIVAAAQAKGSQLGEYGVSPEAFTAADNAIAAYEQAAPAPREAIAGKSAVSAGIPAIMKAGRMALEKLDNLVHIFDAASPQFSAGYKAARVIVDAGRRHDPAATPPA
jgi:hypothetical protein